MQWRSSSSLPAQTYPPTFPFILRVQNLTAICGPLTLLPGTCFRVSKEPTLFFYPLARAPISHVLAWTLQTAERDSVNWPKSDLFQHFTIECAFISFLYLFQRFFYSPAALAH